jgi:hypothetical protein
VSAAGAPRVEILHRGSLMTVKEGDAERCLGYMLNFKERGVYEPNFGQMDITPEEADAHNRLLDKAMLDGLDENCAVGMGGSFYAKESKNKTQVTTFNGTVVAETARVKGKTITFERMVNGREMVFRGRLAKDAELFFFRRVS